MSIYDIIFGLCILGYIGIFIWALFFYDGD